MFLNYIETIESFIIIFFLIFISFIIFILLKTLFIKKEMKILDFTDIDFNVLDSYKNTFEDFNNAFIEHNEYYVSKNTSGKKILILVEDKLHFEVLKTSLNILLKKNELNVFLVIVIGNKISQDINYEFDLLINNTQTILSPTITNLRSHYAFINTIITSKIKFKFSIEKLSNSRKLLSEFIQKCSGLFEKNYLPKEIKEIIKTLGKDMSFPERLVCTNPTLFSLVTKKLLNDFRYPFISGLKTTFESGSIYEDNEYYYVDCSINLGLNKKFLYIMKKLTPLLNKYGINYMITESIPNKVITRGKDYKMFESVVSSVYNIYSCKAVVSDFNYKYLEYSNNIIGFNPLVNDELNYQIKAIEFYTKLFEKYSVINFSNVSIDDI